MMQTTQVSSQKNELMQLITDDFKVFVEEVFGLDNADFHDEIDDIIADDFYKNICITIARGHGKSTHLSVAYPLWLIGKNHDIRILLVSSNAGTAMGFINEILNHIDNNEKYHYWARWVDPTGKGIIPKKRKTVKKEEKWSSTALTVDRDLKSKDPSIQAIGLYGGILSKRADVIIGDDIVNQKNSETYDQREKIKDWVDTTLRPVLVPEGRFIYLGNTWHQEDLVASFMDSPEFDYKKRLSAIISDSVNMDLWHEWANIRLADDIESKERVRLGNEFYEKNKEVMNEGVEVLWPSRFTYNFLFLKRLSNAYSFARMYQCDPSLRPDQKFREVWLDKMKAKGKHLRLQQQARDNMISSVTTVGLDLAISQKAKSDDVVFLTLDKVKVGDGILQPGDVVLRDIKRGKFSPNEVKEGTKEIYYTVKPDGIRIESNAYQESIVRDLGDDSIPVRGHATGGEKSDPDIGINSLAILAELGKLVVPYDLTDARTIDLVSRLIDEMRSWPDGHTGDSLMALWLAYLEMRDLVSNQYTIPKGDDKQVDKQKEAVDLHKDKDKLKQAEKEADIAIINEQEHEKRVFRDMMSR